jgi:hypothetical protein
VPGEAPEHWEAHRSSIVDDLNPLGAVELALAEQIAAKLWRLGRVVRHEADLIAIGQCEDEIIRGHSKQHPHSSCFLYTLDRATISNLDDLRSARQNVTKADERVASRETALRILISLDVAKDSDKIPSEDWDAWEAFKQDLELGERSDEVFDGEEDFEVRHVRKMLKMKGNEDEVKESMIAYWRDEKIPELRKNVAKTKRALKNIQRRYEAALDRLRLSRGLPDEEALNKIQRTRPTWNEVFTRPCNASRRFRKPGERFHRAPSRPWLLRSFRPPPRPREWVRSAVLQRLRRSRGRGILC